MGNAPSSVPYGAQSNAINVQLQCSYNPTGNAVYNTFISLTAPLSGGVGQTINITDATAKVSLAGEVLVASLDQGAASYLANASITFETTNASPQIFVVRSENNRQNISYNEIQDRNKLVIPFPGPNSPSRTLDPIGPITLGSAGQTDFRLRSVDFSVDIFAGNGNKLSPTPAAISCNPRPEYVLASIVVDKSPIQPLIAPANRAPVNSSIGFGQKSTIAGIPVNCTQSKYLPSGIVFNYTFGGTGPLVASNNQAFNLTNVNNFVSVPGPLVAALTAPYKDGGCAMFVRLFPQDSQPGLGLSLANASPQTIDVSNTFVATDNTTPNPLVTGRFITCRDSSAPILFPFPNTGSLTLTNIVPNNQTGSSFGVTFDDVQGNVEGAKLNQGTTGLENWICKPLHRSVLLAAPIV